MSFVRAILDTKFWEPEEAVGTLLDSFARRLDAAASYPEAAVELAQIKGSLGVLFRGLGGEAGVEIKAGAEALSLHRRSWRRRLASAQERIDTARFDGSTLFLPQKIDAFASPELNRKLYLWLAALAVVSEPHDDVSDDPLRRDILRLRRVTQDCDRAAKTFPGVAQVRAELASQTLAARPQMTAPQLETELEHWIRARLAGLSLRGESALERALGGDDAALRSLKASASYRTYRPVLMWGERVAPPAGDVARRDDGAPEPGGQSSEGA